jgi:hypothetical protein
MAMTPNLQYWQHHLDPGPILGDPHVPLPSTLMGVADSLGAVLGLLTTLSDERPEEKEYGVAVAGLAVGFALKVLRHLGLGDDSPAPSLLNLKMAQLVLNNLLATVEFSIAEWRQGLRDQDHEESTASPEGLVIDPGNFSVTYKGKTCELGNRMGFRLIQRLSTARGTYLSLTTLVQDVWHGKAVSDEAVQKQVSTLRTKLRAAGIEGVAFESQPQSYRLVLR